jgi:uncharacterized zinc-type alcohol dehydrogenase-like protein
MKTDGINQVSMAAQIADAPHTPLRAGTVTCLPLGDQDVELAVSACALCHSDLHLWAGDWRASFPLVPGHEVVGRVTRVGSAVSGIHVGARVGLGWQCGACFACRECQQGEPHLCAKGKVRTCVDRPGGLAERVIADHRFVYPLPATLSDEHAAPLLCAGLTVFAPLKRMAVRTGQHVAVVGFGGLGHLAVQFAVAMGAAVDAFDPEVSKTDDALRCGAQSLVDARSTLALTALKNTYDLILVTTPANLPWNDWLAMLKTGGTLCLVGVPSRPLTIDADHLLDGQKHVTGSVIGSPADMRAMLAFAAEHAIKPITEAMPMDAAAAAMARLAAGKARYRIVLK